MSEMLSHEIRKAGFGQDREANTEKGRGMHSYEEHIDPQEPRLNFDIIRLLCDYLTDIPDVLSFALICSALTGDALRRRLQMAPVHLSNAKVIKSFHTFIFSKRPSCAPYIFGLQVPSPWAYDLKASRDKSEVPIIDNLLVAILEAAINIEYLYFRTSISSSVFDTVVQTTTVRELWILADAGLEPFYSRIATFQSPIRPLHMLGSGSLGDRIFASIFHDRLSRFAPTLELLDLDYFQINLSPHSITSQFARVRSLAIKNPLIHDLGPLSTDVLLRLFPNLDHTLTLGPFHTAIDSEDAYTTFRERSRDAQKVHAWSRLDRLVCDAETAYLIALQCPIRRMDIEVGWSGAARYLGEVLRSHGAPRQLYVNLSLFDGFRTLDGLFSPEVTPQLTHLVIFADIEVRHGRRSSRRQVDIVRSKRFLDRLISSIKHLRLTHLRVVFRYFVYLFMRKAVLDAGPGNIGAADETDLRLTADRLVATMPTLQYRFLTTCGQTQATATRKRWSEFRTQVLRKWYSSKAWRVVSADNWEELWDVDSDADLSSCVELSGEAAERIVHEEELELSRHEQDKIQSCNGSNGQK